MFNIFFKHFIFILIFIIICFMGITFSLSTSEDFTISENGTLSSDILFTSSDFAWPTPRL